MRLKMIEQMNIMEVKIYKFKITSSISILIFRYQARIIVVFNQ